MSEHWKSTPKYWCKHCACYVKDTKFERQNHEATAKHQGALKRFLRDLHRGHEREERERERARQEIARLNGVVAGSPSSASLGNGQRTPLSSKPAVPSESQLKQQREQLAEMGVAIPSTFRPEMAIPGEWTVTSTRVIDHANDGTGDEKVETRATGVRKRELTEEEKEQEDAVQGLFKKPRRWGRDSRAMPQEDDRELDALLSGTLPLMKPSEVSLPSKAEEGSILEPKEEVKEEVKEDDAETRQDMVKQEVRDKVKQEPEDASQGLSQGLGALPLDPEVQAKEEADVVHAPASSVVFKKRKPKCIRQR